MLKALTPLASPLPLPGGVIYGQMLLSFPAFKDLTQLLLCSVLLFHILLFPMAFSYLFCIGKSHSNCNVRDFAFLIF